MPKLPSMQDPLDLLREMWSSMGFSIPGMVTPTLEKAATKQIKPK